MRYYGSRALGPLMEACNHLNPVVRFRAVWTLGHTRDPRAYETILRLTDDPDERVRYDATIALGILDDDRAIEPLTRMFLSNDESRPASMAFDRMGLRVFPVLEEIYRIGGPDIRHRIVNVLGVFAEDHADIRSFELLSECVNDPDMNVREDAAFWLGNAGKAAATNRQIVP